MGPRQKHIERARNGGVDEEPEGEEPPPCSPGPDVANRSNKQEDEEKVEVDDLEGDWPVGLQDDPVGGAEQLLRTKVHLQPPHHLHLSLITFMADDVINAQTGCST